MNQNIIIIGAGPCGSLLAISLAQKGYQITLLEKRPDLRKTDIAAGKSINLALSNRGLKALSNVGVSQKALEISIPMLGRMIHPIQGEPFSAQYSGRQGECIHSISRSQLNGVLLDECEKHSNISLIFEADCTQYDYNSNRISYRNSEGNEIEMVADFVFGTDGAGSIMRKKMEQNASQLLFSHSISYLQHAYKELTIPATESGMFAMSENFLHIWPRGTYMLIALPNLDKSFTVTLFLPMYGENSFESLKNTKAIEPFFTTQFPDALQLIPNIVQEFQENPTGILGTVKCYPWTVQGENLLLGDAAHAVVPFYGQGMNASFEDVAIFTELVTENENDIQKSIFQFQIERKVDADAIADLAVENFYEMRDHVSNPVFMRKRKLETLLEARFPYYSKYSYVTFKEDSPYRNALILGNLQDQFLLKFCSENTDTEQYDLDMIYTELQHFIASQNKPNYV